MNGTSRKSRTVIVLAFCSVAAGLGRAQTPTRPGSSGNPYSLENIVGLVRGGLPSQLILTRVGPKCIDFKVDSAAEKQLRAAGADVPLIAGLKNVCTAVRVVSGPDSVKQSSVRPNPVAVDSAKPASSPPPGDRAPAPAASRGVDEAQMVKRASASVFMVLGAMGRQSGFLADS